MLLATIEPKLRAKDQSYSSYSVHALYSANPVATPYTRFLKRKKAYQYALEDLLCAKIGAIAWRHPAIPVHHLHVPAVFLTI